MQDMLGPLVDASDAILKFWEGLVGSWGLAIILMTFTIRLAILPLTFKGVKSMQRLQQLQPEMKRLQERYKDDKQRMNQELMRFYQEQKVNPLGSCLPLLLQIPFFMALFVLLQDDQFKADIAGDERFLFIPNLAEGLTGNIPVLAIMVVLYIGTQLASTAVTAISADPTQRKIMFALPFVFTIFIINFPAGLLVYWITTNTWTIGQQLLVRKLYPKPEPVEPGDDSPAPARGKPPSPKPASGQTASEKAAKAKGDKDGKAERPATRKRPKTAAATASLSGGNGGAKSGGGAAKPPASPRKKRKRSGRRR